MKFFLIMALMSMTTSLYARAHSNIQGVDLEAVVCEAISSTGRTRFEFLETDDQARSTTSSFWMINVLDTYFKPTLKLNNARGLAGQGKYLINFVSKAGIPVSKYSSFNFFFNDLRADGNQTVAITLFGVIPTSTINDPLGLTNIYIGRGSCEITTKRY